eukprot:GEMP01007900.1.p1 GENE.GEMP01007900.1~~GEMP01007900.1.p1  ORF type:complete len:852 (+),score=202.25 GEMP01007900.1:291-2558(+)
MLELLEQEELKSKEHTQKNEAFTKQNHRLKLIESEFDSMKHEIENRITVAKHQVMDLSDNLRNQRNHNEQLRAELTTIEAETQVDIEALEQSLKVIQNKNVEYTTQLQKQEVRENQHINDLNVLKDSCNAVRNEVNELKRSIDGDDDDRSKFERDKGAMQLKMEATEGQIDALKKTLVTLEHTNENAQEENRQAAERYRDMADKVYGLMDQLRLNQMEVKKFEAENASKQKKILALERQIQNCQAKISMEVDAKQLADEQRREAEQESNVLKKSNRKVEENIGQSQKVQEKCERQIVELNEKVNALQTQNSYLASRIDGQEEEKGGLKAELKKSSDRLSELTRQNTEVRDIIEKLDDDAKVAKSDRNQVGAELDYIKREDVLDDTGRQRPILIQSSESNLLEKLQINEYLYEAQQNRNPVPSIVEKIAQLLEMLHTAQSNCDQYLSDLSRSNGLVSALRQKNMILFERTQVFDSFKTRALVRYVMNLFESNEAQNLHLDGLSFGLREVSEMISLMQKYQVMSKVFFISLASNGLSDDSISTLLQLIMTVPYLRALNLKHNDFSTKCMPKFEEQLRLIEGVTNVVRTQQQSLQAHSGNQLRLTVELADQHPNAEKPFDPTKDVMDKSLSYGAADHHLISPSGILLPKDRTLPAQQSEGPPAQAKDLTPPAKKCLPPMKKGRARAPLPPPLMERMPNQKVVDKWQAGNIPLPGNRRPESANSGDSSRQSQRSNASTEGKRMSKSGSAPTLKNRFLKR